MELLVLEFLIVDFDICVVSAIVSCCRTPPPPPFTYNQIVDKVNPVCIHHASIMPRSLSYHTTCLHAYMPTCLHAYMPTSCNIAVKSVSYQTAH